MCGGCRNVLLRRELGCFENRTAKEEIKRMDRNTLGTFLGALIARKMQSKTMPAGNTSETKPD